MIERQIKRKIARVLDIYRDYIYYYMPVPTGYGKATLDYLGFVCGLGFAIEAKRPGGKPTPRQELTIELIKASGVPVFVINDDYSLGQFAIWLDNVVAQGKRHVGTRSAAAARDQSRVVQTTSETEPMGAQRERRAVRLSR